MSRSTDPRQACHDCDVDLVGALAQLRATTDDIEAYTETHMFDHAGLMMSGIDSHTNRPFDRSFVTDRKVPRRAMFDPWSYWTYEDTMMSTGHYLEGLVLKYEVTGDVSLLERAIAVWETCLDVFYQSQVYGGLGCFLRPYGGFDEMERFGEPLGTDQAAPVFFGAYRLSKHVNADTRNEIVRTWVHALKWYADQGYVYRYYKSHQHYWRPPGHHHGSSFYLPAIAFAALETGEQRWKDDLVFHLNRVLCSPEARKSSKGIAWNFKQGGLLVLKDLMDALGEPFEQHFTSDVLAQMHGDVTHWLEAYNEPGMLHRDFPESVSPGFIPYEKPRNSSRRDLKHAYAGWVHGGRQRPRHEATVLAALGVLGNEEARTQAIDVFALRQDVPREFSIYLAEDYDSTPPSKHLYSRTVGAMMLDWWRNVWVLLHDQSNQRKVDV